MHVEGVQFRIRFGDGSETMRLRVIANCQRDSLSQQMCHCFG